ncbi:MAG TPA: PQQ-binding-like beta-propeller repeat protein [Armatimonadota bacterium]|jgi:outer membrane protein assembly factor BamB/plastocyanin
MVRLFRFGLGAALLLALAPALYADPWTGGRGAGNAGVYAATPFPTAPAMVWKTYLGDAVVGATPTDALLVGKSVILAMGKTLVAVSADTGELRWSRPLAAVPVGDLLLLDNQVIATLSSGEVSAYAPEDGALLWKRTSFSEVVNSPNYTDQVIVVATKGNTIEVIERKTGKSLVSADMHGNIDAAPVIMGKSILLCYQQGNMVRLEGGVNRWTATLPNSTVKRNLVTTSTLVLACGADTISSLNIASTSAPLRWAYHCPEMIPEIAADERTVYVGTATGHLHALDSQTGRDRWGTGTDGLSLPAPAIAGPMVIGDYLFVRMQYGLLAAYDKTKGTLVWLYRVPIPAKSASLTVGAPVVQGDDLYFGASDGYLYHLAHGMPDVDPPTFRQVLPTLAGSEFAPTPPLAYVGAIIEDEGSGLRADTVTLQLDQTDLTARLHYDLASGYCFVALKAPQSPLAPGMHRLRLTARDTRGNLGTFTTTFFVGTASTPERTPIVINGEFTPKLLRVRPGTLISWRNTSGGPRTVVADDRTFTSDNQYPTGIPNGEQWAWIVPENAPVGTKYYYHCRLNGDAGNGVAPGPGLTGAIEVVDPRRDLPGLPKDSAKTLPSFPVPAALK